jgi:hypothetical protein
MNKNRLYHYTGFALFLLSLAACKPLEIKQRAENRTVPGNMAMLTATP